MNILDIIKKYNLVAKKKFGQNFLANDCILNKIVDASGDVANKNILEIGPGPGGLTYYILKKLPKKLVSIEIDKNIISILKNEFVSYKNFEIVESDALKVNENDFFEDENIKVIANLPYNVGTALMLKWFNNLSIFDDFTLLLQKEVVDRIIAKPSTKDYGRLSVIVQALCSAKKVFDIKPTLFIPQPKVMSSLVYIKPKLNVSIDVKKLSNITLKLFGQRRKKIKKIIEILIKAQEINLEAIKYIDLGKRAEELSVDEYIGLSNY